MSTYAVKQAVISHEGTSASLAAAVKKAGELGIRVNVAVVDSGGNLAGFLRMAGSFLGSIEVATLKAKSIVSFGGAPPEVLEGISARRGSASARAS